MLQMYKCKCSINLYTCAMFIQIIITTLYFIHDNYLYYYLDTLNCLFIIMCKIITKLNKSEILLFATIITISEKNRHK